MAKNTETLTIKVEAQTDQARRDLHALEEVADDIGGDASKIKIEADTDEATRSIKDLLQDVDKLDSEQATVKLKLAEGDIAHQLIEIQNAIKDVAGADTEVKLKADTAQLFSDLTDVQSKLKEIGALKAEPQVQLANQGQVIGDLEQVDGKVKEIDGQKAEVRVEVDTSPVEGGLRRAKEGTQELSDSARGANSALANMVGNSAQDLGNMAGIAQSAGVAIGQMAEYASDAALASESLGSALKSMAAVAGPIAVMSAAVFGVQKVMEHFQSAKQRQEELKKAVEETTQAFVDGTGSVEEWNQAVTDAFNQGTVTSGTLFSQFLFNKEDEERQTKILTDLGLLGGQLDDYGTAIESLAKGESDWASAALQRQGINEKDADIIGGLIALGYDYDDLINQVNFSGQALTPTIEDNITAHEAEIKAIQDLNDVAGDNVDSLDESANAYLNAEAALGGLNEQFVILARAKFPDQPVEAAKEYLRLTTEQNQTTQQAADYQAAYNALVQRNQANISANQAETERMTFTQEELNEAILAAQDPMETLPGLWKRLIDQFREGNFTAQFTEERINAIAAATHRDPGEIFNIIWEEAHKADPAVKQLADSTEGYINLVTKVPPSLGKGALGPAPEDIEGWRKFSVAATTAAKDAAAAFRDAKADIAEVLADVPDLSQELADAFTASDSELTHLKFQFDFQSTFDDLLDQGRKFKPDTQELSDLLSAGVTLTPDIVFGEVKKDDPAFAAWITQVQSTVQGGIVETFKTAGVDAANAFAQAQAQALADAQGISLQEAYRLLGLGPDGTIDAIVQPIIDQAAADRANRILDDIAGVSGDPRTAQIQLALDTGQITGVEAEIAARILAFDLKLTPTLDLSGFTPEQIAAAQSALAALGLTVPANIVPSVPTDERNRTDHMLNQMAEDRTATYNTEAPNAAQTNTELDKVGKGWFSGLWPTSGRVATYATEAPGAGALSKVLDAVATKSRTANINVKADNAGAISGILDAIAHDRTVHLRVQIDNYNEVERQLDNLARNRTATVTTRLGGSRNGASVN